MSVPLNILLSSCEVTDHLCFVFFPNVAAAMAIKGPREPRC